MSAVLSEEKKNSQEDPGIRQYLGEISRYPLLTAEEEKQLALRCAQADQEAIRTMVNSNLRLVAAMARQYAVRGIPLLDLMQEGSIGLLTAAKRFDPARDVRFSTYATKWIKQRMSRYVMDHAGLIRIPRHSAEKLRKILAARNQLQQTLEQAPTTRQIAAACHMTEKKVTELLALLPEIWSLNAAMGEDEDMVLQQLINAQSPEPYEELVRSELKNVMESLLYKLTERQQQVLRLRFGMDGDPVCSLDEVGRIMGISKEGARQLEQRAMEALRKLGASVGLEDFL